MNFVENVKEVEALFWTFVLVLPVLQYYCGDNGYKIRAYFKTLVSKNTATWRLYQTTG